jgi:hypothetical protein
MNRTELAAVWPPTVTAANAAGHELMTPMQAIRQKCLDCSAYQAQEVRLCEFVTCALWPFRSGRHPYTQKRVCQAILDKPASEGTQVPAEGASSKNPALQASGAECGHSDAAPPEANVGRWDVEA